MDFGAQVSESVGEPSFAVGKNYEKSRIGKIKGRGGVYKNSSYGYV